MKTFPPNDPRTAKLRRVLKHMRVYRELKRQRALNSQVGIVEAIDALRNKQLFWREN